MITLPTEKIPATKKSPRVLTLFGQSKVGKTTMLSELPDCLIIDTEKGTYALDALKVEANSLSDLRDVYDALSKSQHKYKYGAIDTIDNVVAWFEEATVNEINYEMRGKPGYVPAKSIGDIPYGAGYDRVRLKTIDFINTFKPLFEHLIIIGHRKKTIVGNEVEEFSSSTLDLTGKLKNILTAMCDAVGYVHRDPSDPSRLKVSFKTTNDLDAGARPAHLRGQVLDFEWSNIFID